MTTPQHTASRENARPRRAHGPAANRGVAMLLVIVALGTATILSTTFLSGRSNSGGIGANAADTARAQWSAKSAADIGVAVLQTTLDWRTAIADGSLITNQTIAGADVSIDFTNLLGQLPTADDRELVMTVRAVVNGVEERTQKIVRLVPDGTIRDAVDLSLMEFTIFATNSLQADATARLGVWRESPVTDGSIPAKIGLGFTSGIAYSVDPAASLGKVALYIPSDATPSLDAALLDGRLAGGAKLPIHIRTAPSLMPTIFAALPAAPGPITVSGVGVTQSLPPGSYPSLTINNGAVVTLDAANGSAYAFGDLTIQNGSTLVFTGAIDVRIDNALSLTTRSAIEPGSPASRLSIFAQNSVLVDDATIGFSRALAAIPGRDPDDSLPYVNPRRIHIFMVYAGGTPQSLTLQNRAIVAGVVHAPGAAAIIRSSAGLLGRITAKSLSILLNGAVFGDPSLDLGVGFSEPTSMLYTSLGAPVAGLVTALAAINPALGVTVNTTNVQTAVVAASGGPIAVPASSIINSISPIVVSTSLPTPRKERRTSGRAWPMHVIAFELTHNMSGGPGGGPGPGGVSVSGVIDGTFVNTQNQLNNTLAIVPF